MKILDLIKSEFIKNYTFKKITLLVVVLIVSIIGIVSVAENQLSENASYIESQLDYFEDDYKYYKRSPLQDNLKDEWCHLYYQENIEMYRFFLNDKNYQNINASSWQLNVAQNILLVDDLNFWVDKYLENKKYNFVNNDRYYLIDLYDNYIKQFDDMKKTELLELKEKLKKYKTNLENLLSENKFYQYVEFWIEQKNADNKSPLILNSNLSYLDQEELNNILKYEIADENDYRVKNMYQKSNLMTYSYNSDYVINIENHKTKEYWAILDYSIQNNKQHDIMYGGINVPVKSKYIHTKTIVNLILPFAIIIMILVIITSGDVVSKEHSSGTEKLLLTSSNKRWKIHFSKFAYIILNTYIIWFSAFLLLCIYAGIRFGFEDLLTPKLIYQSCKVIEVNYLLYTMKQILYCSIPVISLVSIVFMLSTITLNTTITIGVSMILVMISPFLWHFIQLLNLKILAYTPIPYLMFSQVINLSEGYLKTLDICNLSVSYGIIISIVTIGICYSISHYVYTKRDIKN